MTSRCKTCGVTDPELFTKTSRTVCKGCASQKRKIAFQTKLNGERMASSELAAMATPENTKSKLRGKYKKKSSADTGPSSAVIANLISSQQKMIEHQQRQTDALFGLAEKLLEKINANAPATDSESSPVRRSPVSNRLIVSHTPRVRKNLAHYKDRLNNDI